MYEQFLYFQHISGGENAEIRGVALAVIDDCIKRNSEDMAKIKPSFGDKIPCNSASFLFSTYSLGTVLFVSFFEIFLKTKYFMSEMLYRIALHQNGIQVSFHFL